jgi:hypothetical protein
MATSRFDVNDPELRESFLRYEIVEAIERLDDAASPHWGRMRPQQMVEHLLWALDLSTGRASTQCFAKGEEVPRLKAFLKSSRPTPREFMNPALVGGLPPLRYGNLGEAKAALRRGLERFLDGPRSPEKMYTHPLFGPVGYDEWHRTHYKHAYHHLLQFGLIESA